MEHLFKQISQLRRGRGFSLHSRWENAQTLVIAGHFAMESA
jgi:hypothetical protein